MDAIPAWMDEDYLARLKEREDDLDTPAAGLLSILLRSRESDPT
jgi:hypothetical protein